MIFFLTAHFILILMIYSVVKLELKRCLCRGLENLLSSQIIITLMSLIGLYLLRAFINPVVCVILWFTLIAYFRIYICRHYGRAFPERVLNNMRLRSDRIILIAIIAIANLGTWHSVVFPEPWLYDADWSFHLYRMM